MRAAGFRNAAARQLVMLVGVFVLGWSPLEIALFFLLEVFLFLSLRAAAEITIESRLGTTSAVAFGWELVKHWLVAALFIGLIVGSLGAFVIVPFASAESRGAFDAMSDPSFLIGITLLTGSLVFDTALFARRVAAGRSPEEVEGDAHGGAGGPRQRGAAGGGELLVRALRRDGAGAEDTGDRDGTGAPLRGSRPPRRDVDVQAPGRLRSPWRNASCIRRAMHPGWRRCSSLTYRTVCCGRRALPAGRLARLGATLAFHHGLLAPVLLAEVLGQALRESW